MNSVVFFRVQKIIFFDFKFEFGKNDRVQVQSPGEAGGKVLGRCGEGKGRCGEGCGKVC